MEYAKHASLREDVVLCIDASGSMGQKDFKPTRLEAVKEAAIAFADEKAGIDPSDRIGIVVFSSGARKVCELTNDRRLLKTQIHDLKPSGSTAMGEGLRISVEILEESGTSSPSQPRIVLLSDGRHNSGIPLLPEVEKAQSKGIVVHTVGVGSRGTSGFLSRLRGDELNEVELRRIAEIGCGEYFYISNINELVGRFKRLAAKVPPAFVRDESGRAEVEILEEEKVDIEFEE